MASLHIPNEILQHIVHYYVTSVTIENAWHARATCRDFKAAIEHELLTETESSRFFRSLATMKILSANLVVYVKNRALRKTCEYDFVVSRICTIVSKLPKKTDFVTAEKKRDCIKDIACAFAINCGHPLNLIRIGPIGDDDWSEQCLIRRSIHSVDSDLCYSSRSGKKLSPFVRDLCGMAKECKGRNGLAIAAVIGDVEYVRKSIGLKTDAFVATRLFGTPLQAAAATGKVNVLTYLLEHMDAKFRIEDKNIDLLGVLRETLVTATYAQQIGATKCLVQWFHKLGLVDSKRTIFKAVLDKATAQLTVDALKVILTTCPPRPFTSTISRSSGRRLSKACRVASLEVVQELAKSGLFDLNPTPRNVISPPLICAVKTGRVNIVKALLVAGANVDGQNPNDPWTPYGFPLLQAIERDNVAITKVLIDFGADIRSHTINNPSVSLGAQSWSGRAAFQYAVRRYEEQRQAGRSFRA